MVIRQVGYSDCGCAPKPSSGLIDADGSDQRQLARGAGQELELTDCPEPRNQLDTYPAQAERLSPRAADAAPAAAWELQRSPAVRATGVARPARRVRVGGGHHGMTAGPPRDQAGHNLTRRVRRRLADG